MTYKIQHSEARTESPSEALPSESSSGSQTSSSRRKFLIPDEIFSTQCESELPASYISSVLAINTLLIG